jgi:hypothetical protein
MKLTKKEVEEILKKRVSDFNEKLRKVAEEGLRTFDTSDYQLRIGRGILMISGKTWRGFRSSTRRNGANITFY